MMLRKAAITAGLSLAFAGASVQAKGFEALLKGDYAFTGESSCLVSPDGFDGDQTPVDTLPGTSTPARFPYVTSMSVHGVRTFNGDGTGTVRARVVSMNHPYALPPSLPLRPNPFFNRGGVSSVDIWSEFTYTVTPDLKVLISTPRVDGQILSGPRAGQAMWFTVPPFQGFLSDDHRSLTVAHDVPGVEVHYFTDAQDYRICHRSRILLERKTSK